MIKALNPNDFSEEALVEYCRQLFSIADTNGDGVLQRDEFSELIHACGFDFNEDEVIRFS